MPTDESMKAALRLLGPRVSEKYLRDTATALDAAYERGRAEEQERCARVANTTWLLDAAARAMCIDDGLDPDALRPDGQANWLPYRSNAQAALTAADTTPVESAGLVERLRKPHAWHADSYGLEWQQDNAPFEAAAEIERLTRERDEALADYRALEVTTDKMAARAETAERQRDEAVSALDRVTGHLETWAADHSDERTAEIDAAIHCARTITTTP